MLVYSGTQHKLPIVLSCVFLATSAVCLRQPGVQMPGILDVAIAMWDDRSAIDGVCNRCFIPRKISYKSTGMPALDFCISPSRGSSEFPSWYATSAPYINRPDVGDPLSASARAHIDATLASGTAIEHYSE
jgi:hypothetical protein